MKVLFEVELLGDSSDVLAVSLSPRATDNLEVCWRLYVRILPKFLGMK